MVGFITGKLKRSKRPNFEEFYNLQFSIFGKARLRVYFCVRIDLCFVRILFPF